MRLTVGQAIVRFLAAQWSARDGQEQRFFAGCFGIFGHGNVAGIGQALLEYGDDLRYHQARNEQAMVHTAAGFARMRDRLQTMACTTSIGPGATNMVTGAALATINRLPVLLLPGDVFATRVANPVLQELEDARSFDVSVNDAFKPVSKYWDRINRPEQLPTALMAAMRVLTDPAETGAVTLALPQDVQAEAYDWPDELFERRVWRIPRPVPEPAVLDEAAGLLRRAERPLIVAGGGVIYSGATTELREFAERTGIPVAETQAGKGALPWDHDRAVGAIGATGTVAANVLAREADVVLGIGTRYSDFTTASRSVFARSGVRFVNLNVARPDAAKHAGLALVADAREGLRGLAANLDGSTVSESYRAETLELAAAWNRTVDRAYGLGHGPLPAQSEIIGVVNSESGPRDVVVCAAGSMPGDLHKLWRTRDPKGYHVEYGYSCMGYEIAGGLGVKMADPSREVFVMVGDGSYLMMAQELVTAVQEGVKLTVVLVQNHGFASIGALSESVGSQGFGTRYRHRTASGLDGDVLPVDLAANAASLGADVLRAKTVQEFRTALRQAKSASRTTVVHIETDPSVPAPDSQAWWDVPVAEVSSLPSTQEARARYEKDKEAQRPYLLNPHERERSMRTAAVFILAGALALTACSSEGGKKEEEKAAAGPRLKIAMVTHSGPGDTFWDIVQKGAKDAAAKDNVEFLYSADPDGGKQAQLVKTAIDQKVDGIIVTFAKPDALKDVVAQAATAKIPVVSINSGAEVSAKLGALAHFGQDESVAGEAAGDELDKIGAKKAICVIHEQGNVGLEDRCAGAKKTFSGTISNLFVQGTNMPQVKSTITAKLQADESIDGILTLGAPFAATAVDSAKEAGSSAKVGTFDLNKDLIASLQAGSIHFAVDQQPYLQGYEAIDLLWLLKTNGNVLGGGRPVLTGPAIVTKDSAATIAPFADRGTR